MVKLFKIVFVSGEIWNNNQIENIQNATQKAFSHACATDPLIKDIVLEILSKPFMEKIETDTWDFEMMCNPSKLSIEAILRADEYETIVLIYVGAIINHGGSWMFYDGTFCGDNLQKNDTKIVICTPSPSQDWNSLNKRLGENFILVNYDLSGECTDEETMNKSLINEMVDVLKKVYETKMNKHIHRSSSEKKQVLHVSEPTIGVVGDNGCACVPCIINFDGFNLLINPGYQPFSELHKQLNYFTKLDVGILSHVGSNSILAMNWNDEPIEMNHLMLPMGNIVATSSLVDDVINETGDNKSNNNPLIFDSHKHLIQILNNYKTNNINYSYLSITKTKTSGIGGSAQMYSPIQLYHKIGYGTVELIPIGLGDDDVELKKYVEEWKKKKNSGELRSIAKSLPASISCLIVWRPQSVKKPIQRLLYIGSRFNCKKIFPVAIPALHAQHDYLQVPKYIPSENMKAKTGTTRPKTASGTTARPASAINKKPAVSKAAPAAPAPAKKEIMSSRGVTSAPPQAKKPAPTTTQTKLKQTTKPTLNKNVAPKGDVKKESSKSLSDQQKIQSKKSSEATSPVSNEINSKVESPTHDSNDMENGENGLNGHGDTDQLNGGALSSPIPPQSIGSPDLGGKVVAVGTVECAITEHGEADFCDETPEELSADQMRQLGLYDDDDERGSNSTGQHQPPSNLADLPMEGSFYGKEIVGDPNWTQPLGIPQPLPPPTGTKKAPSAKQPATTPAVVYPKECLFVDHLFVPSDLEKDDLKLLWHCIKSNNIILQLDRPSDLINCLETYLETGTKNIPSNFLVEFLPSIYDEKGLMWMELNKEKLTEAHIKINNPISQCEISIGTCDSESKESYIGYKWEF